jgi:hypothetical protein
VDGYCADQSFMAASWFRLDSRLPRLAGERVQQGIADDLGHVGA